MDYLTNVWANQPRISHSVSLSSNSLSTEGFSCGARKVLPHAAIASV